MKLSTKYKTKLLGRVTYDGCVMSYHQLGAVKTITCRAHGTAWEVASSLAENTDKIWRDIKAEAKASV